MWVEDIDEISVEYEDNGEILVKQEAKAIISRGAWPLLAFLYRDRDPKTGEFGPLKVTVRKFRKQHGTYRLESKVNLGSLDVARDVAGVLAGWAGQETA
jgi:hypothetical protein